MSEILGRRMRVKCGRRTVLSRVRAHHENNSSIMVASSPSPIIAFSAAIVKMRLAKTTSPAFMPAARWCRLFCLMVRLRPDIVAHSHALRVLGRPPTRATPPREVGKIPFVDVRFSCRQEGSQRTLVARELFRHEKRQICYPGWFIT